MEPGTTVTHLRPDSDERFVPLRRELGVTTFGINQMVLPPGAQGRIHRHTRQEEVYVLLEGRLSVLIEGEERHDLRAGDLLRVAPDVRRRLVNRGPDRAVLLALGGAAEHQGRDGEAFASWDQSEPTPPQETPEPGPLPEGERRG